MIEVTENDDKTFTISWDENDPTESIFNDFKEEDFINLIQNYLNSLQESGEIDINKVTEAVNQINDHIEEEFFIDQSAEEVIEDILNAEKFLNFNSKNVQESNYEGFNQGPEDYKLKEDRVVPPPNFPLFPWGFKWK